MTGRSQFALFQQVHRLAQARQASQHTDRECLERFRAGRDEQAFAVLASAGHDHVIRIWDVRTGAELHALRESGDFIQTVALSPDGALVVGGEEKAVQMWDAGSGKPLRRITDRRGQYMSAAFSPDGKQIAFGSGVQTDKGAVLSLWEAATGKELRRIAGPADFFGTVAFSVDGKWLAAQSRGVHVWDSATGKRFVSVKDGYHYALMPDGERVVVEIHPDSGKTVGIWDIATARQLQRFPQLDKRCTHSSFALSPDGRTIAWPLTDNTIELWEVASWQKRRRFVGHRGNVEALAFAPDGQVLFSGSYDTTILAWDLTHADATRHAPVKEQDLPDLWRRLASENAEVADRAIWLLASAPAVSVPFLAKHVAPAAAVASNRLTSLIADLESDQFAVRDRAALELEELAELAEPALRQMLDGKPSLEARRRGEQLVEKLRGPLRAGERLRALRAVEVLEHASTAQARKLLMCLAAGAQQARLTGEARGSLARTILR
jgi:hypothetical protein